MADFRSQAGQTVQVIFHELKWLRQCANELGGKSFSHEEVQRLADLLPEDTWNERLEDND